MDIEKGTLNYRKTTLDNGKPLFKYGKLTLDNGKQIFDNEKPPLNKEKPTWHSGKLALTLKINIDIDNITPDASTVNSVHACFNTYSVPVHSIYFVH